VRALKSIEVSFTRALVIPRGVNFWSETGDVEQGNLQISIFFKINLITLRNQLIEL